MPYDKIDQLYDALKKDGAVSKSRENFRSKMLAPGKEGYQNRLQLYKALKADGAIDSPTYEEFGKRLGLHAVNNTPAPAHPQPQKPTAAPAQAATPAPNSAPATPQQKDKPLTPAQRQAMIDQVQQMQQQTQAMIADNNERMKNMKQYGFGLGFGQTKKGGVKYNPRTKKFEQTYITPTGNRYSSKALADAESFRYRKAASEPLGLNMNDQQVNDAQKPASAAVAALWKEAEAKYAADRNKNAEDVYSGNPWLHGGREMHIVDAATNSHKNEVSRLTRFDLQKMMDNAWGRVGKQMTASCYAQLKKQYPTATERQLQNSASAMARQLSDNAVYKYAVAKNTPKSTLEFFAKTAADMNLLRTINKGLARSEAGTTGDMAAYEQAMSDYGKNHRWAQIGGTVTGMMFDPTTYISGGVGSFAGKTALNIGGRIVAKKAATNVGARLFSNTLTGRVVAGVAGGAGNLGAYEGIKEGESQWLHGGHINQETGENEGYSAGDVLKSSLHGTLLGSVTGTVSPLLGNVADKWVKATSNTAGKVGIRAGELATSTVAEGTIFSIPEWINGDGDAMDVWTDNMSMMLGFKAQHMVKSAPRVIAGLRPIENPKTMQERNHNRMTFLERLRTQLDASPRDMAFTKEEREELQKYGYGDLAALFTRTPKQQPKAKAKQPTATDGKVMNFDIPEAEVEDLGKLWLKTHPEFDGYEAMQRLIQDPSVSQSARAKAYYILTGHQLPMGTVTGYTTEKDEHGNIFVKSVTANGEVVTNRRFADEASAKREQDKIMRQAELNSVDVDERYTEAKADNKVWDAAVEAVAPGADPETVKRNYQAAKEGDKDAIANYGQMVDAIDKFMEENRGMADAERPEAIRAAIKEETGVDVDAAIKKEPSKRTEPEQAAVEDYLKRLFPEQNQETEQPMSDDEAGAAAIYDQSRLLWDKVEQGDADAKADVDAIVLRMQEALQECEDAFGTDAEMRMAEMQDNPWALANDPELTEDQQNAVLYYINAKAAMDGVQDASNDAMENKRREVAANVERHTHKDNGMVQPATMKVDDKPVYIVKGNVAVLPDGTGIDTQNSDQSIVICDAETGEYKFTSPDQIFNLGDAIDPQAELDEAYANIQAEHEAVLGGMGNGESVPNSGESVQETPENVQNEDENVQPPMTDEQLQQYAQGAFNEATQGDGGVTLPQEQVEQMQQHNQQMLEQDQQRREEEANRKPTALERVPLNEETGEPMFEKADKETALDALNEVTGGNDANTTAIVNAQVEQAQKTLDALKKKQPTKKAPSLKGSPMAMVKAQQEADANYNTAMEQYNAQVAEAEETLGAWSRIYALMNERKRAIREQQEAERRERDARLHDEAVAQVEEQKRIAAQKAAEQAEVGTHAVNPKIKAKWDGAAKMEGNPNALTLADGSTIRGHYVLTEAGAASASHDVNNAFEPTEGFPIDENGESVNDRDYKRDTDAQRIVRDIANNYDSRALQSPIIVSKDGVVLSGNNRTMSGDIAAQQGTDKAYIDHLREFGQMYGFTPEQIDGMKHPRVVFVPDEQLPYDATTFARFNAEQQKKQSKPEHAVKLGKIVPDNVFTSITNDISRFDRLSDYYADDKAVSSAISQLLGAGVINEMQLPEMRTGNSLSAAGKELIENTLIGKVFQTSPDAVRHIISTPTLRQSVIMGLNDIAHNRTLAKSGYDLSQELGAAVDLVARAKSAHPDIFKDGMPVSPFGREQGLFDDEYGDSRVTDGTTLLLADILNSGKPSDLRKVLSAYNAQATAPAGGQLDMFTGDVTSKEEILNTINEHFKNATPREQQALVDAAIAERKRIAETEAGQRGGNKATEQTEDAVQRSAEPQQPAVAETEPAKQEETPQTEEPNTDTIAEEEEEDVFGDTVAQLSGSEYALLKNNAEKNVRKYESRRKQWEADQTYIHNAKPKLEGQIKAAEQRAEEANAHLLAVQKAFPDGKFTEITVGKQKFGSVDAMSDFIKEHNKKILDAVKAMKEHPGNAAQTNTLTLSLGGYDFVVKTEMSRETQNIGGSLFAEIHRKMTYSCPELGLTDIPVKQSLLRNAVEDITENVITGKDFAERFDIATRMVKHGKSELEQLKQRESKPFEFGKELEEAKRQFEEYSEAMKVEMAEKEKKYAEMDASVEAATDVVADDEDETSEDKTKFRLLEDDDPKAIELESLPDSELVPVYRNVQAFEDDALGSPMAFTDAETGERRTLQGQKWNYSNPPQIELTPEQQRQLDELNKNGYIVVDGKKTTELQINDGLKFVKPKTKDAQLQYFLKKNPEDKGLWAAYDPYDHAIETPLNTQFGEAYKRPNLVVVRSLIPKSEIDKPFHADYALLPTGAHQWNNGRTLYLSRWSKIDKVLTREEEAKLIDEYWKKHPGKREALKSHRDYNRFVPQVRRELEKMGYRFELDGKELTPEESLALDRQNMENRDVIPGREGHAPFMTNEDIARINAKMSGKWVSEPKEAMNNAMAVRVNELAERLHTPVRIIRTDEEVAALPSARQRRMKGSFNPMTGEVTIVVPNNANMADVENTFIHEVVGHDGLRVLFPEEEKLNNALDELYRVSKDEIRNSIDRMAQKMYDAEVDRLREKKRKEHEANGEDSNASYYADMAEAHAEASKKREQFKRDATEEYGADLAGRIGEKGFEKMSAKELTFWGKLKSMLQKALQKLLDGLKIPGKKKWGDKEWAFVLHEAYKRKKNGGKPDVFDAADTEVMRRKTGFGETKFSDGHKKSAQLNEAALKHLEPTDVEHAAKVQQKREKAKEALANVAKTYKNTTDSKGFISDLSNSLGLTRGSTGSGYGSFETPNGKVFTIRVSNHNINAANVGDEPVESIVIKTKRSPNRFHAEDGKFANEYVYFKEDIRKAPTGTLSAIAESISDLLDTGEYHDKTGLAKDNHSPETDPDGGMKFRDGDMGLDETITQMKIAASQANADNWQAKQEAMKAIGGNLNKLRQAMARQREYDLSTVKSITDLAKVLLDNGLLDDLSKYETKRILSAVNNAHGKQDTSNQVAKVMDIMVDNQLRMGANMLGRLLSTRGSRVDARGIEVQGQLDPDGQTIAQVVRKATSLPKSDIEERIAEALNRMGSDDQAVADEAALEYSGLLLAHQFAEDITDSKAEEKALRDSIKQAKEDLDAGMMEKDAYNEYVAATNDAIRQNKIERAEAYHSIVEQVGSVLDGSVERAKQWREAEKQRVEAIHHNANSDMVGRPTDEHHKEGKVQKIANNSAVRFLLAPLGTFDQMLRMFGKKSVNGEGYLWNRYMRGWVDATEREYKGYQNALKNLDEKVSDVFGKNMKWGDLFAMERKMPKATITFWDGGERKDHELTQGNLLYIYMVDKMADGRMKLRRMGITEEDIENIKDFVDPRFLQLADWMQEEFLVGKRNEYNDVHKRMFGAPMAAIENYFPLKILANARIEDVDVADDTTDTALPATSTGSIIKRRRNNLALDVMGADAFSVILDHIQQMERWSAFAEFNRDLNTLLSYKHFRNQVMNMSSVYGGGKTLWNNFRNVCSMAAGAYRPPIAQLDKAAVNIAKGVTAAKVSFRVFTALKQFLSMPAYLSDSNPVYLAANIANPIGAWKWSMENLPLFEKRWKSRMAGDPRLMKSEMDWKMWRSRVVEIASRIGMSPNAFVDALTVAIGSHAMYKTKKQKYLRYGYDEETAEKRAKQDATILFNQTQQSSESAFLSTMQVDRSWLSVLFTIFRNSSMSYTRQLYDAIRNIKHRFEPGYQSMSEEYMAKQMRRDGIDPDKADSNAKSEYRRSLLRDIARIGVFGYILQFAWNLGAYLPYLIAGDDKDEKSKMWDDVINHTMFGSIEGLTGGDVMSSAGQMALNGDANWSYLVKDMPLASDLATILQKMPKDKVAAMNDVVNLLVQSGVGVNPQSLTDAVVAIMDYCGDDAETSRECALLIARILNCPQSQTDKIYFDELGTTAGEASKMTPAEIAERYAEYKIHRGAPLTGWAYSEEARDSVKTAQQNRVLTKAKEKMSNRMETEATKQLLSTYDEVSKQQTELSKLKQTDRAAYREGMKQLRQKYNMREHGRMKRYKHDMKLLTEKYLRSKSAEERDSLVRVMTTTRDKLLDDIGRMNQQ